MPHLSFHFLSALARQCGFSVVGVAPLSPLDGDKERLETWQAQGFAGEMEFMQRDAVLLSTPLHFLPEAKSALVLSATYDQIPVEQPPIGYGRVARYAWGKDYHKVLRKRLQGLVNEVEAHLSRSIKARVFSDSVPLLERALARSAKTGFVGKNTMVITPGIGSFFFLSEILWDLEVTELPASNHSSHRASCGECTRCLSQCPTGAFAAPYSLNASRCIAYLTIEKRSPLTHAERQGINDWVFGCDVCQEVCPFNFTALKTRRRATIDELRKEFGVGPYLDLREVLRIRTHEQFVARFGGSAIMRAKREGLLRNSAIVAANTCAGDALHDLITAAQSDFSGLVREHALWGAGVLANSLGSDARCSVKSVAEKLLVDTEVRVRSEAESILSQW